MPHEGKYIYGIIATDEAANFGPIGIDGGDEVVTIGAEGLSAVISRARDALFEASRKNLTTHTQVIEKVADRFTILPMRFCTIAESTDAIIALLEGHRRDFASMLKDFEGKKEIGIKIIWKDMKKIFAELSEENRTLRMLRKNGTGGGQQALIRAGELVEAALEEKKAVEGEEYLRPLKRGPVTCKELECTTEDMVTNASFLVDRDWIREFDTLVETMGEEHKDRIDVKYVGPMPPFSFVNLEMHFTGGTK